MKTIKVKVTLGHIAMGERGKSDKCMVSLAVLDALNGKVNTVYTSHKWMGVVDSLSGLNTVSIPAHVTDKIIRFDAGLPVSPFEFTIDIP